MEVPASGVHGQYTAAHAISDIKAGGHAPLNALTLLTGKFLLIYREKRGKEKGKMEKKRRKIKKGKVENWKWKEEKLQNEERTSFHFSKPLKFVLGLPKSEFSTGEKSISCREKIHDKWLCPPPLKNIPLMPLHTILYCMCHSILTSQGVSWQTPWYACSSEKMSKKGQILVQKVDTS